MVRFFTQKKLYFFDVFWKTLQQHNSRFWTKTVCQHCNSVPLHEQKPSFKTSIWKVTKRSKELCQSCCLALTILWFLLFTIIINILSKRQSRIPLYLPLLTLLQLKLLLPVWGRRWSTKTNQSNWTRIIHTNKQKTYSCSCFWSFSFSSSSNLLLIVTLYTNIQHAI